MLRVVIRDAAGNWREESHHLLGRYAVAALKPGDDAVALVQQPGISWVAVAAALAAVSAAGWLYLKRKKQKA